MSAVFFRLLHGVYTTATLPFLQPVQGENVTVIHVNIYNGRIKDCLAGQLFLRTKIKALVTCGYFVWGNSHPPLNKLVASLSLTFNSQHKRPESITVLFLHSVSFSVAWLAVVSQQQRCCPYRTVLVTIMSLSYSTSKHGIYLLPLPRKHLEYKT